MLITDERMRHMHGVAEFMYNHADDLKCDLSREELYLLGLLHDIGYMNGKEYHESFGSEVVSRLLNPQGQQTIARYIRWHGCTPQEYIAFNKTKIPNELILLWWADMSIESAGDRAGENVGFKGRLKGIEERYGKNSRPYRICKDTINWLEQRKEVEND